jgi:hypothetical protein
VNVILVITLFTGLDLYFLENSYDLLVRVLPEMQSDSLVLYYSFAGTEWDSVVVQRQGRFFDATLSTPANVRVAGFYAVYDNDVVDADNGEPYLYEVRLSPKMLMPFSMVDLEIMLGQAKKKVTLGQHISEAITVLAYVNEMLAVVPVKEASPAEVKRNFLQTEVNRLNTQLGQ